LTVNHPAVPGSQGTPPAASGRQEAPASVSSPHPAGHAAWLQALPAWCVQSVVFLVSFAILVSRRPETVFRPQFWSEDGWLFYAQAYNSGLFHPVFWAHSGYLHLFPRLIADLAQFVPLVYAPLLFNLVALGLQILPVQLLISARLAALGSLPTRLLLGLLYLALPNSSEIHANITGAHWRLALLVFLVIVSGLPQSRAAEIFDYVAVLMCGLTGPFAMMLAPVALLFWWKNRERWKLILASTLVVCAGIQGTLVLISHESSRTHQPLGPSFAYLFKILADHVYLGALIGRNLIFLSSPVAAFVTASLGTAIVLYAFFRGPLQLKLFILFAGLVLVSSLASPREPIKELSNGPWLPGWEFLAVGACQRYWFIPMLAFVATLVWLLKSTTPPLLHLAAIFCFILMSFGVLRDWHCWPLVDYHFSEYAERFQQAPRGTVMVIPTNPAGWWMRLEKH
jgi:hypothetical protein